METATPTPQISSPTDILADLTARGLLYQSTKGLAEHLAQPRTLYSGFDPTADSLHIGSLVPLLTLKRFQQAGHTPIILVGGATGMIGDPSFKAQERKLNDETTIRNWVEKLKTQTSRFVTFKDVPNPARMANNYEWTHNVSILTFLRDVGKHFSVNSMINKEAVRARLEREETGISFTEFSYALLQASDFLHLYQHENCTVQIGGSDQWGNITAGTDLIHKAAHGQAYAATLPLVTKADGTKFGKTESGTIWLSAEKTSPYAFYQFFLNTADADVEKFLLYFSFQPLDHIRDVMTEHQKAPEKRIAQTNLAYEITEIVHGKDAAENALEISAKLFNNMVESLAETDYAQLAAGGLPTTTINAEGELSNDILETGGDFAPSPLTIVDALILANLATSKREARDFLKGNAVEHNGEKVTDETLLLTPQNAMYGKYHLLKRGKKNFALLIHA